VPLLGVRFRGRALLVEPGVRVVRATTADRGCLANCTFLPPALGPPVPDVRPAKLWWCSLKARLLPPETSRERPGEFFLRVTWALPRQICTALRLTKPGWCSPAFAFVTQAGAVVFESSSQGSPEFAWQRRPWFTGQLDYELTSADAPLLRGMWDLSRAVLDRDDLPSLRQGISSFNRAYDHRPIDVAHRIAELVAGLEALFVYESEEVGYRLGLRCACLLESRPTERARIRDEIRAAYLVRSRVVHGQAPPRTVKVVGTRVSLEELAPVVEERLRVAIRLFLHLVRSIDEKTLKQRLLDQHILAGSESPLADALTAAAAEGLLPPSPHP